MTPIVEMRDLHVRFTGERTVHALNGVDIALQQGEVLGLLGESGSGKSVTLRALMRLLPKKRTQIAGKVNVMGRDVLAMNDEELRPVAKEEPERKSRHHPEPDQPKQSVEPRDVFCWVEDRSPEVRRAKCRKANQAA